MTTTNTISLPDHSRSLCRSRLRSALRSALACSIVGIATLYTPTTLRHHLKFPAFSYVTAMLIVADATLGDSLRGAALALYGTSLGLLPALMTFYVIRPEGISAATASIAAAISAFVVAVSESTGLIAKRVALGQIVIVYVTACKEGAAVLHPVPVAASTAVGAVAAVVALVLPYPRLACYEVKEESKLYAEITMERLRISVNAFCADNSSCMAAFISRAKYLTGNCNKLLRNIKLMQGSIQWERPPFKFLPPYIRVSWDRLQAIETSLKGMELALASTNSAPMIKTLDRHFKEKMVSLREQISIKLTKEHNLIKPDQNDHTIDKAFQSFHVIPLNLQNLPPLFFIFCMKLLYDETLISSSPSPLQERKVTPTTEHNANSCKREEPSSIKREIKSSTIWSMNLNTEKVVIALKCSLSLGLAVLFGILFSKDNGYWSGLMVAIAFTPFGEATFNLASVRAHGTALGSVYGVLGSFISQNLMEVRLLALIPWVFFTSFLHRSRMYGQVGATAAAISAMIILGRKNYGSPMIFSIQRLTEAYIGLCCSIFVELILQPARATSIARGQLLNSFRSVHDCIESVTSPEELKGNEKKLRQRVNELKKYIGEAELEPNFWFSPFPIACYNKLHSSLSKMGDLLLFLVHSMDILMQESREIDESIKGELDKFKELVGTLVKCLEEIIQVKSLERLEKQYLKKKDGCNDLELGKGQSFSWGKEECEKVVACFIQHAKELVERVDEDVSGDLRSQLVLCFATIGFCIGGLMREMREMEKGILELVQWENPSHLINLYEITCKIKDVST